jgi:uncharacterized protein YacL
VFIVFPDISSNKDEMEFEFILINLIGMIFGFFIGSLAGIIFNPQKRFYKIIIGAIASAFAGGMGFSLFPLLAYMLSGG